MTLIAPPENTLSPAAEAELHGGRHESYVALVWRRLKRSLTGMIGLVLVVALLVMSVFAPFFAPVDPKATDVGFASPDSIYFTDKDGNFTFRPRIYPIVEGQELDPITFQPLMAPDYDNPVELGFFVRGFEYPVLGGLFSMDRHFVGSLDGRPVHFFGTDKFGRDVLSRIIYGSRVSLMIALTAAATFRHNGLPTVALFVALLVWTAPTPRRPMWQLAGLTLAGVLAVQAGLFRLVGVRPYHPAFSDQTILHQVAAAMQVAYW